MVSTHKFEDMFPSELEGEMKRCPVIYLPSGGVEYHGPYQALGSDFHKGHEVCLRTAEAVGGVVHPVVPVVPDGKSPFLSYEQMKSRDEALAKPAVFGSGELCRKMYIELFHYFAECLNFKICVAFGSHGPAGALFTEIADENNGQISGMTIIPCTSTSMVKDLIEKEQMSKLGTMEYQGHGGLWETSMYMACRDNVMDYSELQNPTDSRFKRPHDLTYLGCKKASKEFGEKLINNYVERLSERIKTELKNL